MHRPEHDAKPLTNIFNRRRGEYLLSYPCGSTGNAAADGATSISRVQLPDAPQFHKVR